MSNFQVGGRVFFNHPEESWAMGTISEVVPGLKGSKSYKCVARAQAGRQQFTSGSVLEAVVSADNLHAVVGETEDENVDDLLMLSYLHESTLLAQVRKRYFDNVIYTRIGPIVLALNPFDYNLPNYVDSNMPKYMAEGDSVVATRSSLLPHAWSTAHLSYWLMRTFGNNQSIIVSGESGAGKTETAKIVVKYLGNVSTQQCSADDREGATEVTRRVNSTSPILEAFGNAKTVRNDNSSRFGKFMKVQFSGAGVMVGSLIEVYLLEKSRIVTHGPQERGYHSFYQLLRGASSEQRDRLSLEDATQYKSLAVGNATVISGVDDSEDYQGVCDAMNIVGMSPEDQSAVWDTVAGVLSCLRIDFDANGEGSTLKKSTEHFADRSAEIWQVDAAEFKKELVSTATTVAGETFVRNLRPSQASDIKDALAKALYEKLFLSLVEKINALINNEAHTFQWVGLLDIFGFESFDKNSFEQVCINLANETLQNHYNNIIFTRDMEECKEEGIDTASVTFYDNQPCLDLISGKLSILSLLDEECALGKGSDMGFCDKVRSQFAKHENLVIPRTEQGVFVVRHYAGEVRYDTTGFREKNMDPLKDSLKLLLRSSASPLIASLLPPPEDRHGKGKALTVGGLFRQQLGRLMDTINSTHPHWIRCVKPHHAKKRRMFHGTEVMNQLRYAGVLETVRIRKMSYSMRFVFDDFWRMFRNLLERRLEGGTTRDAAGRILQKVGLGPEVAQVGKTKVFLKFDGYHEVNEALHEVNATFAETIQRAVLAKKAYNRVHAERMNRHVKVIAAHMRGHEAEEQMRKVELAAREKYLLKSFRNLLILQSHEETARNRIEADGDDSMRVITSLRRIDFDRVRAEWVAQQMLNQAKEREQAVLAEAAGRREIVADEDACRAMVDRLRGFNNEEADARAAVEVEEAKAIAGIRAKVSDAAKEVAELMRKRAERIFLQRVAALYKEEAEGRDAITRSQKTAFHYDAGLVAVMMDALFVGVPRIWKQEAAQWDAIYRAERDSMEWNERKWWTEKAANDKRDVQSLLALEYRERMLLMREEEQDVIAILTAQDRHFEEAAAMEWQRMRDEDAREREEQRLQQLHWQRQEEQRRAEQQRLAQMVWSRAQHQKESERQRQEHDAEETQRKLRQRAVEAMRLERERAVDAYAPLGARRQRSTLSGGRPNVGFEPDGLTPSSPRRFMHFNSINPTSIPSKHSETARATSPPPYDSVAAAASPRRAAPTTAEERYGAYVRGSTTPSGRSPSAGNQRGGSASKDGASPASARSSTRRTGDGGLSPATGSSADSLARLRSLAKPRREFRRTIDPNSHSWQPPNPHQAYLPDGSVVELPVARAATSHAGATAPDNYADL